MRVAGKERGDNEEAAYDEGHLWVRFCVAFVEGIGKGKIVNKEQ